jgi:CubicO group peptidase (beta-lactamase class C family)
LIAIGSAYKAKVLSWVAFGSGRHVDPSRADEVRADSYWPMRLLRARMDADRQSVTVSFLGLRPRSARFQLLAATPANTTPKAPRAPQAPIADSALQQNRKAESAGARPLTDVVDSAFLETDPSRLRRTRAVIVAQDGRVLVERYAAGFDEGTRFPGWSMTKSVAGALIGVLVGDGRLALDDRELLPQWRVPDPRSAIRLEDLLRMRSGLEFSEVYADLSSDVIDMLFNQTDCAAYAAGRPLTSRPGSTWNYSSGTTNILCAIARRSVGAHDYLDWPRRALFDPVGMTSAVMEPDASGTFVGSSFMLATARDWMRFGQLCLQDGVWEGRQVLPADWMRFSTSPTPESPDGLYGAHWWLKLQPEMGGTATAARSIRPDAFFAIGHEGQTLTVIPSLRLVVVRLGLSIYVDAWNQAEFIAAVQEAL